MASVGTETGEICPASVSFAGAMLKVPETHGEDSIFDMQYRIRGERERNL